MQQITNWISEHYRRIVKSIAFLPAIIALLFLAISVGMVSFDFSETGKDIKSRLHWLSLKDASTARSIISAIATGIISLSVFSFSMVMIILNQTASNLSNRILDKLIGNRFQQMVLGFYIGSIVYALFLLSTIRDINEGVYVPALSTYLLIALTILDIFLFIYFLHYVTQSVKYETIIHRIWHQTEASLLKTCTATKEEYPEVPHAGIKLPAPMAGILQRVDQDALVSYCKNKDICVYVMYPLGTYLLEGSAYIQVTGDNLQETDSKKDHSLHEFLTIEQGHSLEANYHYGFRQLMEVAVKALSPGINDPGTAVESLQAITSLLQLRMRHHPKCNYYDDCGSLRLVLFDKTVDEVLHDTLQPIWYYGHKDPVIQQAFHQLLSQLNALEKGYPALRLFLKAVEQQRLQQLQQVVTG